MIKNIVIGIQSLVIILVFANWYISSVELSQHDASQIHEMLINKKIVNGTNVSELPLVKPKRFYTIGGAGTLSIFEHDKIEIGIYIENQKVHSAYINSNFEQNWQFVDSGKLSAND